MSDDVMPVFVIKAKDNLSVAAIRNYAALCESEGLHYQAESVMESLAEIEAWRERNPEALKWPDHPHVPAGQPGSGSEPTPGAAQSEGSER